jgi:hypothetical protein
MASMTQQLFGAARTGIHGFVKSKLRINGGDREMG